MKFLSIDFGESIIFPSNFGTEQREKESRADIIDFATQLSIFTDSV